MSVPDRSAICAVVVTYHPDAHFPERIAQLRPQVQRIVIVDNASNPDALAMLRALAQSGAAALLENGENLGVAAALNRGVAYAASEHFSWVILFDQDSAAQPKLVDSLRLVCERLGADLDRLGVLGINHVDPHTGTTYAPASDELGANMERKTVITSGTLLSLKAYDAIGPFRDEFFIDGIDHEYCLRARSKNHLVVLALAPQLVHTIGRRQLVRVWPGVSVLTLNHAAFRWYFIVRNRLVLVQEYARQETSWVFWRLVNLAVQCVRTLLFEPARLEKARYMGLGLADFALRRAARHPTELIRSRST
jgi:rhamnosyltransferase